MQPSSMFFYPTSKPDPDPDPGITIRSGSISSGQVSTYHVVSGMVFSGYLSYNPTPSGFQYASGSVSLPISSTTIACPNCGYVAVGGNYCSNCGSQVAPTAGSGAVNSSPGKATVPVSTPSITIDPDPQVVYPHQQVDPKPLPKNPFFDKFKDW